MEIKQFSKWRPSVILNFRKLPFWSRDLYLRVILHLRSKFRINRPIFRQDIAKNIFNMASVHHLEFAKYRYLSNLHLRNGNLHPHTKFDRNLIIHGWDMEIKLFSKWRQFSKIAFWSRDLYLRVILHHCSKFHINQPIWCRDIAKKRFSIWRTDAILDLLLRHQLHFMLPTVLNFYNVRLCIFWNTLYFMFQHFGLKLPIYGLILTISGEK